MWVSVEEQLPPELDSVTTSVWLRPGIMQIGVMQTSFLYPPTLWAKVLKAGVRNLRKAPALLTELQQILNAPVVYAEAELDKPRNQALLLYLGFVEISTEPDRKIYSRSV